MSEIHNVSLPFIPVGGIRELKRQSVPVQTEQPKVSFGDLFEQEINKLRFSAHAQSRLTSRDVQLSDEDLQRIDTAIQRVQDKGGTETLVMLRDMAFVVSVPNKTVITAMQKNESEPTVFTNIDS
ncbi:MAG TPA: TIGR02530 family flagellar biosynthesis protein, partial [Anaerolineales bacterium]|nr:TIGR02530 family flagellar biosynthesis protein [Anaerolineales bacterium]